MAPVTEFLPVRLHNLVCSNYHSISILSTAYKILFNILLSSLTPYVTDLGRGDNGVDFDMTNELLTSYSALVIYLTKKYEHGAAVQQLFTELKKSVIRLGRWFCIIFRDLYTDGTI
jgi:hypothetical protein